MAASERRVTASLRPDADQALANLLDLCPGYSASELINKALRLLDVVETTTQRGGSLMLVEGEDARQTKVILL